MTLRLVLVEDQALMLHALAALLALEPGLEVIGAFQGGAEALAAIPALAPDLVVTDIEMPGISGIDLALALKAAGSDARVLLLSTFARRGYAERALEAGIRGYLLKDAPPRRLVDAIRNVAAGLTQIDAQLLDGIGSRGRRLTERERIILRLVGEGRTNPEIATALGLAHGTIRNAISELLGKLGARNRIEASKIAITGGWL